MTPTPKRASGNPAKQAEISLTVKQQREQKRQEKLAEYQRQLGKRRRSKLMWWVVGGVGVVVVAAVVVASFIFVPPGPAQYTAGGTGTGEGIEGVETFDNDTQHVEGVVDYPQSPPAGGPHNQLWLNCGVYTEPQQNEYAVHSMEHGAIWVTYDPALIQGDDLAELRTWLPGSYSLLSPYEGMDTPIAVSAWNAQLKVDSASDARIGEFFEEFWRSSNVPEPNGSCSGAITGEGRA